MGYKIQIFDLHSLKVDIKNTGSAADNLHAVHHTNLRFFKSLSLNTLVIHSFNGGIGVYFLLFEDYVFERG